MVIPAKAGIHDQAAKRLAKLQNKVYYSRPAFRPGVVLQ